MTLRPHGGDGGFKAPVMASSSVVQSTYVVLDEDKVDGLEGLIYSDRDGCRLMPRSRIPKIIGDGRSRFATSAVCSTCTPYMGA